jgi:hypothetical protein
VDVAVASAEVTFDELQDRAIEIIARRREISCTELGFELWPTKASGAGHKGTAPLARSAGRVVARLRARGLVRRIYDSERFLFELTPSGRAVARESTSRQRQAPVLHGDDVEQEQRQPDREGHAADGLPVSPPREDDEADDPHGE